MTRALPSPGRARERRITREFVQAHGGTIHMESEPGVRTTFTVQLPLG